MCILTALVGGLALAAAPITVDVRESEAGLYAVQGGFTVQATPETVWATLTDYNRLHMFMPEMRSHIARRDGPNSLLVAQTASPKFLGVSALNRVVLRIEARPLTRIDFTDISHQDFKVFHGYWRLEHAAGVSRVSYVAWAQPRWLPPVIGASLISRTVQASLEAFKSEVMRRGG